MTHQKPIHIIIADDHEFFRNGLALVLQQSDKYKIVAEVADGEALINNTILLQPDLLITDILMPKLNGIQATSILKKQFPDLPILALSMYNEESIILEMMEAGAMGFLDKNIGKADLYHAIDLVVKNKELYFPKTTNIHFFELLSESNYKPYKNKGIKFTEREVEVIQLTCKEFTNKEIAAELQLSKRTIETHRTRIMEKMNVKSVAGLVAFAYSNKMIQL
jgi:DNA-binding NarL/FixJ family response regulator